VLSFLLGASSAKIRLHAVLVRFTLTKSAKKKSLFGYIIGGWGWFSSRFQKVPTKGKVTIYKQLKKYVL